MRRAEELAPTSPRSARSRDAPMAMTAHLLYPAWDAGPAGQLSPAIIAEVIRGEIGFDGLLMSDDIGMERAVAARPRARAQGGARRRLRPRAALLGRAGGE